MIKNLLTLGTVLNKEQQRSINGGVLDCNVTEYRCWHYEACNETCVNICDHIYVDPC